VKKIDVLAQIRGGLIVSCQALAHEPLHGSSIMSRMALAAVQGGAVGIRANTVADITAIQQTVDLPIIGIIKQIYDDSDVYISPTMAEIDALCRIGVPIIATDATNRLRPGQADLPAFFAAVRVRYPDVLFMADCSTLDEAVQAERLGFDLIGTTLSGYTAYTQTASVPNFELLADMHCALRKPIIAEGGIHSPEQAAQALRLGAFAVVVGGAITRPQEITARFVAGMKIE